jgi:FkbM family methyltransferase
VVRANREKDGGFRVYKLPFQFASSSNDQRLLELLKLMGIGGPSTNPSAPPGTIIDIGLPHESITFAKAGFETQSFEARQEGYNTILSALSQEDVSVQSRVHLHHTALSNYTGTTEIFDAEDSSSLVKGAVVNGDPEKVKFLRQGERVETVTVTTLDNHFRSLISSTSVVGIKIDTQGVEPEIFLGAQSILGNSATRPRAIVTEYCSRFRPFEELSVGMHLLIGLGYACYYADESEEEIVVTAESGFCSDFYCTHEPLQVNPH